MLRQAHLIASVGIFLIGGAVLLPAIGCAGMTSSETSSKKEQGSSPETTESEEEARCEGTRTIKVRPEPRSDVWDMGKKVDFTTYDPRGCPKGGLLSGTDQPDNLAGRDGDDEIRGLGAEDYLIGGLGNDVIYGGPGSDRLADWPLAGWWGGGGCGEALPFERRICREVSAKAGGDDTFYAGDGDDELGSDKGEDVLYGGDGNDYVFDEVRERERDELYCGKGDDVYGADKNDYVDGSCERTLDEVYSEGPN